MFQFTLTSSSILLPLPACNVTIVSVKPHGTSWQDCKDKSSKCTGLANWTLHQRLREKWWRRNFLQSSRLKGILRQGPQSNLQVTQTSRSWIQVWHQLLQHQPVQCWLSYRYQRYCVGSRRNSTAGFPSLTRKSNEIPWNHASTQDFLSLLLRQCSGFT